VARVPIFETPRCTHGPTQLHKLQTISGALPNPCRRQENGPKANLDSPAEANSRSDVNAGSELDIVYLYIVEMKSTRMFTTGRTPLITTPLKAANQ
jgi:hypothetical protein